MNQHFIDCPAAATTGMSGCNCGADPNSEIARLRAANAALERGIKDGLVREHEDTERITALRAELDAAKKQLADDAEIMEDDDYEARRLTAEVDRLTAALAQALEALEVAWEHHTSGACDSYAHFAGESPDKCEAARDPSYCHARAAQAVDLVLARKP